MWTWYKDFPWDDISDRTIFLIVCNFFLQLDQCIWCKFELKILIGSPTMVHVLLPIFHYCWILSWDIEYLWQGEIKFLIFFLQLDQCIWCKFELKILIGSPTMVHVLLPIFHYCWILSWDIEYLWQGEIKINLVFKVLKKKKMIWTTI